MMAVVQCTHQHTNAATHLDERVEVRFLLFLGQRFVFSQHNLEGIAFWIGGLDGELVPLLQLAGIRQFLRAELWQHMMRHT